MFKYDGVVDSEKLSASLAIPIIKYWKMKQPFNKPYIDKYMVLKPAKNDGRFPTLIAWCEPDAVRLFTT